jgi:hypothetical protein
VRLRVRLVLLRHRLGRDLYRYGSEWVPRELRVPIADEYTKRNTDGTSDADRYRRADARAQSRSHTDSD